MVNYKLLTPGPLTTTKTVKEAMLVDHCTWDEDYKQITQQIRQQLLNLARVTEPEYTTTLMQGSGSFGVESVLLSSVGKKGTILLCINGAYGDRMKQICDHAGINYIVYQEKLNHILNAEKAEQFLKENPNISHLAMVHCETTTGILNDLISFSNLRQKYNFTWIVDAMSSFGGIEIPMAELGIDFLISSANKCIQGVPGFSFVLGRTELVKQCQGNSISLALDLYDQWQQMNQDGKWRFTSPTHTVLAFAQALRELKEEGGIVSRNERYTKNCQTLISGMKTLGFSTYVRSENQSPIITTFYYPENMEFSFEKMYEFIKERGYAIYPGKLTTAATFRIGNIGDIHVEDMNQLIEIFAEFLEEKKNEFQN